MIEALMIVLVWSAFGGAAIAMTIGFLWAVGVAPDTPVPHVVRMLLRRGGKMFRRAFRLVHSAV